MQGFDNKALILFPAIDLIENRSSQYMWQLRRSVSNLLSYLKSMNIEAHVFYTDDVARMLDCPDFKYVSTLSKADRFFISNHCDGCSAAMSTPMLEYDEVYNSILANDPWSPDMNEDAQFEMVLRHSNKAASKIIPTYKIVVHFAFPKRAQYKVVSKPGDGKIRINISANTFVPIVLMGGCEDNACDLLGVPYANRSLVNWEVDANVNS